MQHPTNPTALRTTDLGFAYKNGLIMKFQDKDKLDAFLTQINDYLVDDKNKNSVLFSSNNISPWNGDALAIENATLLENTSKEANIYMLFTAKNNSTTFELRYIGKTTKKLARQRLRNHLFKKHDDTGAKLDQIISHVTEGGSVKVSWVKIEPESLRNWAEEELIFSHPEADWNRENA